MQAFQVAIFQIYRAAKPVRDAEYLRWLKRFPCVACKCGWRIDPAHTGPHGIGQKSSDASCVPLCRKCHREFDANPRAFAERHGLDVLAAIAFFQHLWRLKNERSAR